MATYDKEMDYDQSATYFKLKERHIYGSSRVGVRNSGIDLLPQPLQNRDLYNVDGTNRHVMFSDLIHFNFMLDH